MNVDKEALIELRKMVLAGDGNRQLATTEGNLDAAVLQAGETVMDVEKYRAGRRRNRCHRLVLALASHARPVPIDRARGENIMHDEDLLPLPSIIQRAPDYDAVEHMRTDERNAHLRAQYQDRLLASRDPEAHPDAVARRYAEGVRVLQRLAAHCARLRLKARIKRDKARSRPKQSGVVVQLRGRS